MSMTIDSTNLVGADVAAPALVPAPPQPWYMTPPAVLDRQALEDQHTRILAQAVGDHPRP